MTHFFKYIAFIFFLGMTISSCKNEKETPSTPVASKSSVPAKKAPEDVLEGAVKKIDSTTTSDGITYKKGTFSDKEPIQRDTILKEKTTDTSTKTQPKKPSKKITSKEKTKPKSKKTSKPPINKSKFAPKISFKETTWNFGEIVEGDIVDKEFEFTNTGKAPLQILIAKATCGCTQPTFPFLEIAPGDTGKIGVRYNSVGKEGDQNPEVTVEANTYPKTTVLKISGTVKPKPKEEKKEEVDEVIEEKPAVKDSTKN